MVNEPGDNQVMSSVNAGSEASIALRHDRADLRRLLEWIDGRIEALSLGPTAAHAVRLCLEEAVLNIVMHNDPPADPAAAIRVWLGRRGGQLRASVADNVAPFDPLSVPAPPRAENLAAAAIGGLGIPIMRRFSKAMEYRREYGANLLEFRFDD